MKQTLHTSHKFFKLALFCLMAIASWGGNYAWAQEVAYKTLSFPDGNSKKIQNYTSTWSATINKFTWSIENFNNNNNGWEFVRAGSKKNATVATISNTTAFDKPISKIVVTYDFKNFDQNYVNSISLEVSSDADFTKIIETVSQSSYSESATFNISEPKENQYFRLKYDLKKGQNNGFVQINKIEYFDNSSSNKTATTLSFETTTAKISKGQTFQNLPILKAGETTLTGKTYKWTSDDEDVATVAEDGTVTGVGGGKANITATFEGDDTYNASKASYEIAVIGKPEISFAEAEYETELGKTFSSPELQGVPKGVGVSYASSNTDVATVDAKTGAITIINFGSTTITAKTEATDFYEEATASYILTIKKIETSSIVFDFIKNNYENAAIVTGDKKEKVEITFGTNKEDANENTLIAKWYDSGNAIRMYSDSYLTITAPDRIKQIQFFFKNKATKDNSEFSTGNYNYTTGTWNLSDENTNTATLSYTASSKYISIQKIIVTTYGTSGTISIATDEGYGTYYTDNNFVLPQGLTAFGYISVNGDGSLNKSEEYVAGDIVPANTAVVVKGNKGDYDYYATDADATKTIDGNLLKGVTETTKIDATSGVKRYILTRADNGALAFYQTTTGNINVKANRAYLEIPEALAVAAFNLEAPTTGINNAVTTAKKAQGIYTLGGVRLKATTTQGLPAGAYIVDGKVVIVK